MKKRIAIVLAVVLLFTFVGSVGADGPFTWDTGFQVQNLGTATANITITYYRDDGSVAHTVSDTIPPGESKTYYQPSIPELGTTFDGSVVITSDQPIAAIANQTSYSQEPNLAASYNGVEGTATATTMMAPIIFKNYGGGNWTTRLAVQNAGSAITHVTVTYHGAGGTWTEEADIPLGARHTFDQAFSPIPDGFVGSAVVTSDGQPLAVVVNEISPSGMALSYTGFSAGATNITAPLLFKNYNDWNTGLQVQNMGTATANVEVTYYWAGGTCTENATIEPGASHTFYQPANTCLPDGFVGSAVVTSDQPVVAIVNEVNYARGTGMSYNTLSGGTTTVNAPLLFKNFNNWNTGLQVQNVGTAATHATVTYYGAGGTWTEEADIEPGASHTFYQPANPSLPDGFVGSAVVESDGQPIVAVINETNYARSGDAAMSYTGINQ